MILKGLRLILTFAGLDVDAPVVGRELGLSGGERRHCGNSDDTEHGLKPSRGAVVVLVSYHDN